MHENGAELGILARGREDWDDAEAEFDTRSNERSRPNYDPPEDEDTAGEEDPEDEPD